MAFRTACAVASLAFGVDAVRKARRPQAKEVNDDGNETAGIGDIPAQWLRKAPRPQTTEINDDVGIGDITGVIDGLYTWGAPGVSSPSLKNPLRADGCFPGKRAWNRKKTWGVSWVDPITTIAGVRGFRHPYVEGVRIDVGNEAWRLEECNETTVNRPKGTGYWSYHSARLYRNATEWIGQDFFDFTYVTTKYSKKYADDFVVEDAPLWGGWRLVGRGHDDGESEMLGGPQVSNLFQNPQSLECVLTFQGTRGTADWFANFDSRHTDFCGLNGTTVHAGFRNHLRRMVRDPSWQEKVRPRLSRCGSVYVAGHSLGGALATLFSACVNSGNRGDPDFDSLSWTKASPGMLGDFGHVAA